MTKEHTQECNNQPFDIATKAPFQFDLVPRRHCQSLHTPHDATLIQSGVEGTIVIAMDASNGALGI
eukprot:516602-Alexandrium_andersonii.AAC.1